MKNEYQVVVSNVGTVYFGNNYNVAGATYEQYKQESEQAIGKAAGEDVTAYHNGESYREYIGARNTTHGATEEPQPCGKCVACLLRKAIEEALTDEQDAIGAAVDVLLNTLSRTPGIEVTDRVLTKERIIDAIVSTTNGG